MHAFYNEQETLKHSSIKLILLWSCCVRIPWVNCDSISICHSAKGEGSAVVFANCHVGQRRWKFGECQHQGVGDLCRLMELAPVPRQL